MTLLSTAFFFIILYGNFPSRPCMIRDSLHPSWLFSWRIAYVMTLFVTRVVTHRSRLPTSFVPHYIVRDSFCILHDSFRDSCSDSLDKQQSLTYIVRISLHISWLICILDDSSAPLSTTGSGAALPLPLRPTSQLRSSGSFKYLNPSALHHKPSISSPDESTAYMGFFP